jgi:hypothetical protein
MIYKWESEEERLLRFMRISPKTKMEWLREMNDFIAKSSTERSRLIRRRLRETR